AEDHSLVRIFIDHTGWFSSATFSPDGQYILTGSHDGTARLWERASGQQLVSYAGHTDCVNSVAFSSDDQYVLTSSVDRTTRLWKRASRRQHSCYTGHRARWPVRTNRLL